MHSDSKKRHSFLAPHFAAGDVRRLSLSRKRMDDIAASSTEEGLDFAFNNAGELELAFEWLAISITLKA